MFYLGSIWQELPKSPNGNIVIQDLHVLHVVPYGTTYTPMWEYCHIDFVGPTHILLLLFGTEDNMEYHTSTKSQTRHHSLLGSQIFKITLHACKVLNLEFFTNF